MISIFSYAVCDEDLSLDLETKSTPRKVQLVAAWNITDKSSCKTTNKSLVIRQKDLDACTNPSLLLEDQQTIQIDTLSGVKDIKVIHPNSLYDVTLEVICGTGDTYKKTVQQRTDETGKSNFFHLNVLYSIFGDQFGMYPVWTEE